MRSLSITAVIAVRNEAIYLEKLLPYLACEGIEVVLIDNSSSDGTSDLFTPARYSNIITLKRVDYAGVFDLTSLLEHKAKLVKELKADWVIHQDADEILQSPHHWGSLRFEIEQAHWQGFNVMNFHELVMLPFDVHLDDHLRNNRRYYFFEPRTNRLMRAWQREIGMLSLSSGGHNMSGDHVKVAPTHMILKHFMIRSQQHAWQKYLDRQFAEHDLKRGWHGNRIDLNRKMLTVPESGESIHVLTSPQATPASLPAPVSHHYWHWKQQQRLQWKKQFKQKLFHLLG